MSDTKPVVVSQALAAHRPTCPQVAKLKNPQKGLARVYNRYRRIVRYADGREDHVWAPSCCGRYLAVEMKTTYVWKNDD